MQRRDFLLVSGRSLVGLALGSTALRANAQQQIELNDPVAKALHYTHASQVEGAHCENCLYIQGETGPQWRPCAIFPDKTVSASGWCTAWQKKP